MPTLPGLPWAALAFYAALAIGTRGSIPVGGPLFFVLVAFLTVMALFPLVMDRWLAPRIAGWASTLVFPMAMVAQELVRSHIPNGPATWGSFAYTQYGNLPLMQLAAVTGIWGITFLIAWFASIVNWAWERGFEWRKTGPLLTTFAALMGAIMIAGALRIALAPPPARVVRAAVVTFPRDLFTPAEMFRIADGRIPIDGPVAERLARLHEWFFESSEREARAGAQLVAWPEMNFLVRAEDEPAAIDRAKGLAAREHVYLAMGIGAVQSGAPKPFRNETVLVDPSGRISYAYSKSRPVIGWEDRVMQRGDGHLPIVATDLGRVSSAICFEGDHPDFIRQVGRGQAELWILPANDWAAIKQTHFQMAVFRAIENGTATLRAVSAGVSGAFDPMGRVVAATDHFTGAPTMVAQVPVGNVPTLYPRIGDLFGWLCVAGCGLTPVLLRLRSRSGALPAAATAVSGA
jgi:apolipoprotein N-acyltransferase